MKLKTIVVSAAFLTAAAGLLCQVSWRAGASDSGRRLPCTSELDSALVAANGVIEGARPEVPLRFETPGCLATIRVREGQQVRRGDVLAELHNESRRQQVALAQADVKAAQAALDKLRNGERTERRESARAVEQARKAQLDHANADLARTKPLRTGSNVSPEEYDAIHFRVRRATADWLQAKADLALVEAPARFEDLASAEAQLAAAQAKLGLALAELAKGQLRAPSAGQVVQVVQEPGEMPGPETSRPVLVVSDLSRRRVRAFVEEFDLARVQLGQAATVSADGWPGRVFPGRVVELLPRMGKRAPLSDAAGEYRDVYYREVLLDLEQADELPLQLRVRVEIQTARP